jgi:hypothetical protein
MADLKPPRKVALMAISNKARTLHLTDGSTVVGWVNYIDDNGRDVILSDGSHRWIGHAEVVA